VRSKENSERRTRAVMSAFAEYIKREIAKWANLVKNTAAKVD
jgi:hypothetical protein